MANASLPPSSPKQTVATTNRIANGGSSHPAAGSNTAATKPLLDPNIKPRNGLGSASTPGPGRRFNGDKFCGHAGALESYNTYKAVMGSKEFFRVGMMDR